VHVEMAAGLPFGGGIIRLPGHADAAASNGISEETRRESP